MARLAIVLVTLCVILAAEALYRWSNGLGLDWGWAVGRVCFLLVVGGGSSFGSWLDSRKCGRSRDSGSGILSPLFFLAIGGWGVAVCAWRVAAAIWSGRIVVSTATDAFTSWTVNPFGFGVALAAASFGGLFFLFLFAAGGFQLALWMSRRRRRR